MIIIIYVMPTGMAGGIIFLCYALLIPLKSKKGEMLRDELARVFEHTGPPVKFQTDKSKDFYN